MGLADITSSPEARAFTASLASTYGISPAAAQGALAGLLPALAGGIESNTMTRGGIADLMEALASGHHQDIITNPALAGHPDTIADGNAIIGHLLGPGGLSQSTLQTAAAQAGVPAALLGNMAPAIAVFLLGYLFRNSGGVLGSIAGSVLGGSGLGGVLGGGGMGQPQMPPMGGAPVARPLGGGLMPPLPDLRNMGAGNNPYGNIANSIRNGGLAGGATAGGVRDILGSLFGFGSSRGIVGWIIRLLVLRYGMSILRVLLRSFIR